MAYKVKLHIDFHKIAEELEILFPQYTEEELYDAFEMYFWDTQCSEEVVYTKQQLKEFIKYMKDCFVLEMESATTLAQRVAQATGLEVVEDSEEPQGNYVEMAKRRGYVA